MKPPHLHALLSVVLFVAACGGGGGDGGGGGRDGGGEPVDGEPDGLTGITAAHNAVRADATPKPSPTIPELTWSNEVAAVAQDWAERCKFEHSSNGYGENIYASYGSTVTGQGVTDSWSSEADNYDYGSNSCDQGEVCGHYTQVVWRSSTKLGCGIATCTKNSPFGNSNPWQLVVCNYDPPGNYGGQKPY